MLTFYTYNNFSILNWTIPILNASIPILNWKRYIFPKSVYNHFDLESYYNRLPKGLCLVVYLERNFLKENRINILNEDPIYIWLDNSLKTLDWSNLTTFFFFFRVMIDHLPLRPYWTPIHERKLVEEAVKGDVEGWGEWTF